MRLAIDKELRVNRVCMARGNTVPHMREAALVCFPAQFGSDFESAYELAHRAGIRKHWACHHAFSFAKRSSNCLRIRMTSGSLLQRFLLASSSESPHQLLRRW